MKSASGPFKATFLWAAALVAVVVAGLAAVALVNRFVLGPEGLVKDYFALLQEGEGGRALGLLGAEVPEGNPLLLDGDPLGAGDGGVDHLGDRDLAGLEVLDQADRIEVAEGIFGEGVHARHGYAP